MTLSARQKLVVALEATEKSLAAENPGAIELQFERACLLAMLGELDLAKARYLEILHQDPTHFGTLNNLGTLLYETSYWDAARTVYKQAVLCYPDKPVAHVNLANLLFYKNELEEARKHYETALELNPQFLTAHQGLSAVFMEMGDEENMLHHRELGYASEPLKSYPFRGSQEAIPLLLITSSIGGGELPWRRLVDENIFSVTTLVAAFYDPKKPLPPHKLIFNVISDADLCQEDLKAADMLLKNVTAPVLNPPTAIMTTGRIMNAKRLEGLPGVITPRTLSLSRADLENASVAETLKDKGLHFPLLLRSPGFHTGKHFERVNLLSELPITLKELPGNSLLVIEYLNASGNDGCARKYRVMMIDGKLYPYHLAISDHWKVHYFTADMTAHKAHQVEEAAFLNDMPNVLGEKGMKALEAIGTTLGLDFCGIDFGLDEAGNVLVFEANATMLIKQPEASDPQWHYRLDPINLVLSAARAMLIKRAQ